MNISRSFVNRPIFAGVISMIIFLAGLLSMLKLPVSEYPNIIPPSVVVTAQFPGANPKVIAETVATPLEEQINGVENMLYMSSLATADGMLQLTVTFKLGTDANLATQLVQNRVDQALSRLPEVTRQLGVTTVKSSPNITMAVNLYSSSDRYDLLYLRNYGLINIKDKISKINGIGQVVFWGGGDYAMRVWLNPQKIAERHMNPQEVINAIRRQNVQVAAGVVGGPPYADNVELQLQINTQGRLSTEEEFGEMIVKRDDQGVITRLKDVARVEIDASTYSLRALLNKKDSVAFGIFQAPNTNSIEISNQVRSAMAELAKSFPEGIEYEIAYDPTMFVRDSIDAVIHTLLEALALVVLVVILFLQTWRASIIPLLAVPVSIIGTFAIMHIFGFSINTLSLFGMVLAIGIVVDDAIVVVENVERNIHEGLNPHDATVKAMSEVTGPIIAITLVLCAVFVPIAFISGLTGQFYSQFALTIAFSTVISAFNSLTMSPALCAILLKPHDAPKDALTRGIDRIFGKFFSRFNNLFKRSSERYGRDVSGILKRKKMSMTVYAGLLVLTVFSFLHVPTGFIPTQDKEYLMGFAQLPDGATLDRTEAVLRNMSDIALKNPGVEHAMAFPGLSINGFVNSSSTGIVFVLLKDFDKRKSEDLSAMAISNSLQAQYWGIQDAFIAIFQPPPVDGIGTTGGFKLQIEDQADAGYERLNEVLQQVIGKAMQTPELTGIFSSYKISVPQLHADLDRTKAMQLGVDIQDVFDTMQIYLGSLYVNDFNKFGRTYQVIAQADSQFRAKPDDILKLQIRNDRGEMVPLGSLVQISDISGPEIVSRYNAFRAADINGAAAPGYSSGQAQQAITKILEETLPKGMHFEWTDLTYQEILAGNTAMLVFPICVLLVFLVLAAKYESLFLPLSILLIVPLSLLAAIFGVWISGGDNNIFTQISFLVLAGLASKNAILIVEFAHELERKHGFTTVDAAIEAAKLRLRPILMTSFAFIMGVIPLVFSSGAGAEMRHAMGVAVFSGMLGVTLFGLFLTPVFYLLVRTIEKRFFRQNISPSESSYL